MGLDPASMAFVAIVNALQPPLPCPYPDIRHVESYELQKLASPGMRVHGAYITEAHNPKGIVYLVNGEDPRYGCHEISHFVMSYCMGLPKDQVQEKKAQKMEKICDNE